MVFEFRAGGDKKALGLAQASAHEQAPPDALVATRRAVSASSESL